MNFNNWEDLPWIDDGSNEDKERQEISKIENLTKGHINQEPQSINSIQQLNFQDYVLFDTHKNSSKERPFPWWSFLRSTIWAMILLIVYYVDIATDVILLMDYSRNEMWGYFGATLIFLLLPLIVASIRSVKCPGHFESFLAFFAFFLIAPLFYVFK